MNITGPCVEPGAVDGSWMTEALEAAGVAQGATVTNVELVRYIGTGQMGRNARYRLTWSDPTGRPAPVVGKFPTDDLNARTGAFANGSYIKEWAFYAHLKPTVTIRTPEVWVGGFDEAGQNFTFIMEDIAGNEQGDQMRGLTEHEASLAVEQLVKLHAPHWGNQQLLELLGGGTTVQEQAERLQMFDAMTMEGSLARLGGDLLPNAVQLVRDLAPLVARWLTVSSSPSTLTHMDYRPDNFLFAAEPDAPPLVVVDWQTIGFALGTNDLAYMIGGSFEAEQRRDVEGRLVEQYRRQLAEAGVHYDVDTCWTDYRIGSLWGVVMSVLAAMMAEQTERGDLMLFTMLRRHAQHAIDLDALALLR